MTVLPWRLGLNGRKDACITKPWVRCGPVQPNGSSSLFFKVIVKKSESCEASSWIHAPLRADTRASDVLFPQHEIPGGSLNSLRSFVSVVGWHKRYSLCSPVHIVLAYVFSIFQALGSVPSYRKQIYEQRQKKKLVIILGFNGSFAALKRGCMCSYAS